MGGPSAGSGAALQRPGTAAAWYATVILTLAYTFSFVDRQVLNLLVEPIRHDLGLSDTSISFLQGLAFVIPYVLMSVPIGRLVDKFNRILVLIAGVLFWSVATFGCGVAGNYGQLMAARMGVGVGEASLTPAAWSLLADYFPPDKLARPVSFFLMGPYLGAGLALIGGAAVIDWAASIGELSLPVLGSIRAWQFTFMMVALPGVLIAALLAMLPNPQRQREAGDAEPAPGWSEVMRFMKRHARIYLAVLLGVPFLVVVLYGLQGWVPTILVRVYGWDLASAGRIYGTLALVAGSAGVLSGPVVGGWLKRRGYADYPLRLATGAAAAVALSMVTLPFQTSGAGALVCIGLASFFVTLPLALMTFVTQTVTPRNMRGVLAGFFVVGTNVIGLGLGPTLVAATTDYVLGDPGKVHVSLMIISVCVAPVAMLLLWSGMRALGEWERQNQGSPDVEDSTAGR
ncbi:MAG TPA: MFS transporter [Pseudomonadales bacterium]